MVSDFFRSISFSLGGLSFLIVILLLYANKPKYSELHSKVFLSLTVLCIIIHFIEFAFIYALYINDEVTLVAKILCYAFAITALAWLTGFTLYLFSSAKDFYVRKKKILYFIMSGVSVVILFAIFYFPMEYIHRNGVYTFGGKGINIEYILSTTLMFSLIPVQARHINYFKKYQKLPLIIASFIIIPIFFVPIIIHQSYNVDTLIFDIILTTLYFTIESQDNLLTHDLEISKSEAEKANKAKTDFLANMSHDIRTPLNTIIGFSESMLEDEHLEPTEVKKGTDNIHQASLELLDLINNILDISRIESGKVKLEEVGYSLEDLMFEINSNVYSKINKDIVDYSINVDNNLPSKYLGDYSKIHKAVVCVLLNAIKHTKYGKVSLQVNGKKVDDGYELEFYVHNTGHSMKQEEFDKDLEQFMKLDNDSGMNTINSGSLGFIIAKRMVDMLGGRIDFINEPGKGTQYHIFINQKVTDESPVGEIFEEKNNEGKTDGQLLELPDKKILIVDDNLVNIKLATRLLERYKFQIDSATGGNECIEKVKNNKYDLIFLDHMMPDKDGIATMKALKSSGYKIPAVIALTANSYSGLKEKYLSAGFSDYLSKPINFKKLNKIIMDNFKKN